VLNDAFAKSAASSLVFVLGLMAIFPKVAAAEPSEPMVDAVTLEQIGDDTYARSHIHGRMFGLALLNSKGVPFRVNSGDLTVTISCVHFCSPGRTFLLKARNDGTVDGEKQQNHEAIATISIPVPDSIPWGVYNVTKAYAKVPVNLPDIHEEISIPPLGWKFGSDENLATASREYVGKTVQGFGDLVLDCEDPHAAQEQAARHAALAKLVRKLDARATPGLLMKFWSLPPEPNISFDAGTEPSLKVLYIERPDVPPKFWKIGGGVNNRWAGDRGLTIVSPLLIRFADTKDEYHSCRHPSLWMADTWEVERTLWIHAPLGTTDRTPIRKGMSKELVAHILGFPSEIGTKEEMFKLDTWKYLPVLPPFSYYAQFKGDRLVIYQPPGAPP